MCCALGRSAARNAEEPVKVMRLTIRTSRLEPPSPDKSDRLDNLPAADGLELADQTSRNHLKGRTRVAVQVAKKPPSTAKVWPVIMLVASDARKMAAPTTSCG